MNKKIIMMLCMLSTMLFSLTIEAQVARQQWKDAHEKNDALAQYILACAYDPQQKSERSDYCLESDRDSWCESTQFYSKAVSPAQCIDKNEEKYIYWLKKSANNGHHYAQTELGLKYIEGKLFDKDIKKGIEWLEKADAQNDLFASYQLGLLYQYNAEAKPDYSKALTYYEKAAKQSHRKLLGLAQYQLYLLYENNLHDSEKAFFWKRKAAENVSRDAGIVPSLKYQIAMHYLNGGKSNGEVGKPEDQPNYVYLFQLSKSNLEQTSMTEQAVIYSLLGWMYLNGYGVEQDIEQAANFYLDSQVYFNYQEEPYNKATESFPELQKEMLTFISSIKKNSINRETATQTLDKIFVDNPEEKKRFLILLLERISSISNYIYIDDRIYQPYGIQRQIILIALSDFVQQLNIVDAMHITGSHYQNPSLKASQYKKVLEIDPNHIDSLYALATIYDFYVNMPEKALPLYRQAAEQSHRLSSYRLGVLNYLGSGTKQNYHEAWKWLNQAASLGDKSAQQFLIKISADNPEAEWLKEQYINHTQVYMSPTVLVDGQDWLEMQTEQSPERYYSSTLHQAKEKDFTHEKATRKLCNAALALAKNGDQAYQQRFVDQLSGQKEHTYNCEAPISLMLDWIDNSEITQQRKNYLQARLYMFYPQDKTLKKEANNLITQLIKEKYPDALAYYARKILLDHNSNKNQIDKALIYANQAMEQGHAPAIKTLMIYYESYASENKKVNWNQKIHELNLLYNDYTQSYVNETWLRNSKIPFFHFYPELESKMVYSVWFNIAQKYQKGDGVPQDLVMSYVWYSLLVESGQTEALVKQEEIKQQLTPEQMKLAQERLRIHRQAYQYYPIQTLR